MEHLMIVRAITKELWDAKSPEMVNSEISISDAPGLGSEKQGTASDTSKKEVSNTLKEKKKSKKRIMEQDNEVQKSSVEVVQSLFKNTNSAITISNAKLSTSPMPSSESQASNVQLCSKRTIIPSTSAEKLNKIGDNASKIDGKENIKLEVIPCPEWLDAAHAHFVTQDLAKE
ncbi:hypothetical protein C0995_009020 [Termitomyces sp. Mi166|nr:hypothetical protein C0995_009020 [Termitomyces sp. Mi166\